NGIKEALKIYKTQNLQLSSVFNVPMPSNYTPYGCPSEEKQQSLLTDASKKIDDIVDTVSRQGSFVDTTNTTIFEAYIHPGIHYRMGYQRINILDKSFYTDVNCNGCAICQKICPVDNITMNEKRPVWNNRCQQCYACLHWCPRESIQAGKKTVGIKRYHNPFITLKEIIISSGSEL
ncbi:EFR1 family ferrodoxin, partial [Candidatus Latescibacterota bacterium]